MPDEELVVNLDAHELLGSYVVAIRFAIRDGHVVISEDWDVKDELYGSGIQIRIPRRVWFEGMMWLNERLKK